MKRRSFLAAAFAAALAAILVPAAAAKKPSETPDHYQGPVTAAVSQPTPVTPQALGLTPEQAFGAAGAAEYQAAKSGGALAAVADPRATGCWVVYITHSAGDVFGLS